MHARRGGRLSDRTALAGVAATGMLVGHLLTYLVVRPDAHAREILLSHTGHGSFSTMLEAAILLAIAGCASLLVRVAGGRRRPGDPTAVMGFGGVVGRLALLQCGAFAAMEVVERLASGAPVSGVLAGHLLFVGLAIQVLVAGLGALVLRWLTRAAEWIGVRLRRPRRRVPVAWPFPPSVGVRTRLATLGSVRVRAPPRSVVLA
jgi:hypothetical protein